MATAASQLIPTSPSNNSKKLTRVLKKFLEHDFKIGNGATLNIFFNHLVKEISESDNKEFINKDYNDVFCEWLIEASNLWEKQEVDPPNIILSFALNLASILSKEEHVFVQLNSQNVYESLVGVAQKDTNADKTRGLLAMLCAFLDHKSGVQWVIATTYWADIIKLGRKASNEHIRKKSYEFVAKLLQKSISFNRNFCRTLVAMLIKPIQDALKKCPPSANKVPICEKNFDSIKPSISFINQVAEEIGKSKEDSALELFFELKTSEMIHKLVPLSENEDFSLELLKIQNVLLFHKLVWMNTSKLGGVRFMECNAMLDLMSQEIIRDHVTCMIKLWHYSHVLYCNMAGRISDISRRGDTLEFQVQLTILQLMPVLIFLSQKHSCKIEDTVSEVFKRDYVHKLLKITSLRIVQLIYKWKERLLAKPDFIEYTTLGLVYIMKTKSVLDKERAAIFFQPLVYCLRKTLNEISVQELKEISPSYALFLNTLIDAIIDLVQTFDLTWRDSIATISVLSIACQFLNFSLWSHKLIISGLMLLNLAISKYMSPNMVLLMVNSKDSLVSVTGSILYIKCQDSNFEIRDAALENVYTLSMNANSKFPSFTNILLEASLPQLVVQMALKDGECCVRSTAFKCLQEMIQIQEFWDIFMKTERFQENIINVLECETNGIVCKEVTKLIYMIYRNQHFPVHTLPRIYDLMTYAATRHACWEVRLAAQRFWFYVVETHLNNEGMLDGEFPEVTFSKEQKKIVTLNEAEVRKRLIKVLNQMSRIGCLYCLKCGYFDNDMNIVKQNICGTLLISRLLKHYKVSYDNITEPFNYCTSSKQDCPPSPASSTTMTASECTDLENPDLFELSGQFSFGLSPSPQGDSFTEQDQYTDQLLQFNSAVSSLNNSFTPLSRNCDENMIGEVGNNQESYKMVKNTSEEMQIQKIMEDLLNTDDTKLLEQMYSSCGQLQIKEKEIKKSVYFAPSEYVKLIYEIQSNPTERTQHNSTFDFSSLLDKISEEYNVRTEESIMDCS